MPKYYIFSVLNKDKDVKISVYISFSLKTAKRQHNLVTKMSSPPHKITMSAKRQDVESNQMVNFGINDSFGHSFVISANRSENTGKFLLRNLAALTNSIYCISQHGALMNRF